MTDSAHGPSRRTMLKSGAAIGGLVWAVPVVQVVSMTPAHAATTSAPTRVKGTSTTVGGSGAVGGVSATGNDGSALPRTGADIGPVAAVGAGAVALGAAAVVAARKFQASDESGSDQT